MARLSIIVPALNEEDTLGALLGDLAPLRAGGHQVILADGGSSDRTRARAAGRVDRIVQVAPGRAAQMNAAAAIADGDILWFLHADTRLPASAAGQLLQTCADGGRWGRFDVRLSGAYPLLRIIEGSMNLRSRLTGIATGDQGLFVDRQLFDAVGRFPEIPLMEDIALSRTLRDCERPRCIRRPRLLTSSRRWEQCGIVRTLLLMWRLRLAYALGTPPARLARHYR